MSKLSRYIETDRDFYRRLLAIAVPVILQSLITTGVNLVDNIMVGQLSEAELSGTTQANQFITLFMFMTMGISMGASVLVSRFWGAKDMVSLKKVITIALRTGLGLGMIFTLLSLFLPDQIMSLYFRPEDVAARLAGISYLRWSTAGFLLMAVSLVLTNISRSTGRSQIPLIASACAFGINIIANYLFIFGKFGCPQMGAAGAALGTVIARVVETGVIAASFLRNKAVRYRLRDLFSPCAEMLSEFLRISVPVMVSDTLLGLGDNVLSIIMGQIGHIFVSANAITVMVQRISTIFITGLSFSSCFLTGHVLGEGKVEAARKQGNTYLYLGIVIGCLAAIIISLVSSSVISMYNITEETRSVARQLMRAVSVIVIFRATNSILTKGVLRGGGDTRFLMVADLSTMWVLSIPLGILAALVLKLPAFWIFIFLHIDQIVKAIWCVFRLQSGKWIKKVHGVQVR